MQRFEGNTAHFPVFLSLKLFLPLPHLHFLPLSGSLSYRYIHVLSMLDVFDTNVNIFLRVVKIIPMPLITHARAHTHTHIHKCSDRHQILFGVLQFWTIVLRAKTITHTHHLYIFHTDISRLGGYIHSSDQETTHTKGMKHTRDK